MKHPNSIDTADPIRQIGRSLVCLLVMLSVCGGCRQDDSPSSPNGTERTGVVALGRLEPITGTRSLTGMVGDRLGSLEVAEGEEVKEGQVLAYLQSRHLRKIEVEALDSQIAEAQARLTAETNLADAQIAAAELGVEKADTIAYDIGVQQIRFDLTTANLALAMKDLERITGLPEDLVSAQQHERQQLLVQQAQAEQAAAAAVLGKLRRTLKFAKKAADADLAAARAGKAQVQSAISIASLKAQRELAQRQLEQTAIVAPCKGVILKIFTQVGETIARKPVFQMGDVSRMVVVAEVYETDIKRIHPEQRVLVKSKAFLAPYDSRGLRGEVTKIGKMISTPELKSLDPFARADRRVVEVSVEINRASARHAADFVNLQVDVTFLAEGESYEDSPGVAQSDP